MSTFDHTTEAAVVAEIARQSTIPDELDPGAIYAAADESGGVNVLDTDRYAAQPRRKKGTVVCADADALNEYVGRHLTPELELWGDPDAGTITAVLNPHDSDGPGWGDHRAVLRLRHTPDWEDATRIDRQWLTQGQLAEWIEDHITCFVTPEGADMLELAQSFQAAKKVEFKSSQRLSSGETALNYQETIDAKAGRKGAITIPDKLTLALQPFEGGEVFKVGARFRYRLHEGDLRLSIALDRPRDVLRAAFTTVEERVSKELDSPVLHGTPIA